MNAKHYARIIALTLALFCGVLQVSGECAINLTTQLFASGHSKPVFLVSPPGDAQRIYVVEQTGRIYLYKNGVNNGVFLDLSSKIVVSFEQGLLGMAFHPNFPDTPYFYVDYTAPGLGAEGHTVVERYTINGSPDLANASGVAILAQAQPQANHNAGMISFGPDDGYLYIAFGDGGGANDQHGAFGNGQNPGTFLGKILRIDVDGSSPYSIPPDNPFVGKPDTLDEIWSLGLRNPWRFCFDRVTSDMYIADVGQQAWEEIDFEPSASAGGINYGWRLREGQHCFNPSVNCDPSGITTDPIYEYDHSSGRCSITGGFVYRGCEMPELQGTYFFGDYCSGEVWSFSYDGAVVQNFQSRFQMSEVSSFGQDATGELYICQLNGEIHKIVPLTPSSGCGCCVTPGDASADGTVNIADVTHLIAWIFSGGANPLCLDEGDANGDNSLNIADVTYLIAWIFSGGADPICGSRGF